MADAVLLENAWLLTNGNTIAALGPMSTLPSELPAGTKQINCAGRLVLPGFVDSHTHLVFAQSREGEYVDRIRGLSYEEIAKKGGGILNSAKKLQATSEDELLEGAIGRANEILNMGTTTVEIKSGYGLTLNDELKMLRVARRLSNHVPLRIRTTFLGAHAIPLNYRDRREAYIQLILEEMIPAVAEEKLADFIDVFCDRGFFTVEETARILEKGTEYGLKGKIHANELAISGGVQIGVEKGALSVDHLECIGEAEIKALQSGNTIPTVLPGTSFFLGIPYAPARRIIDAGLPLAVASDYNPGSSPSGNMSFMMAAACTKMKLLPEEALVAITLNAAATMELSQICGSLEPGKSADLIITEPLQNLAQIPYYFGRSHIHRVMVQGEWTAL